MSHDPFSPDNLALRSSEFGGGSFVGQPNLSFRDTLVKQYGDVAGTIFDSAVSALGDVQTAFKFVDDQLRSVAGGFAGTDTANSERANQARQSVSGPGGGLEPPTPVVPFPPRFAAEQPGGFTGQSGAGGFPPVPASRPPGRQAVPGQQASPGPGQTPPLPVPRPDAFPAGTGAIGLGGGEDFSQLAGIGQQEGPGTLSRINDVAQAFGPAFQMLSLLGADNNIAAAGPRVTQFTAQQQAQKQRQDIARERTEAGKAEVASRAQQAELDRLSREGIAERRVAGTLDAARIRAGAKLPKGVKNYVTPDGILGTSDGVTLSTPQGKIPLPDGSLIVSDRRAADIRFEQQARRQASADLATLNGGQLPGTTDIAAAAEKGSGLVANAAAWWNHVQGMVTDGAFGETNKQIVQARREIELFNNRIMGALTPTGGKLSTQQQEWIRDNVIPDVSKLARNPVSARRQIETLRDHLTREYGGILTQLGGRVEPAQRTKLSAQAEKIRAILREIGSMGSGQPEQGAPSGIRRYNPETGGLDG